MPGYKAEHYYPVELGEVFQERYKTIGKLGYGTASTVWLCHDTHNNGTYVALKVYTNASKVHRQLPVYRHINSLKSTHDGSNHIRKLLDSFELDGPNGRHTCLVYQALGMNIEELKELLPDESFDPDFMRACLRPILRAMYVLHGEARIIHSDHLHAETATQEAAD